MSGVFLGMPVYNPGNLNKEELGKIAKGFYEILSRNNKLCNWSTPENIRVTILENYNPDDIGEHHLGVWASRPDIFERLFEKMKNYGFVKEKKKFFLFGGTGKYKLNPPSDTNLEIYNQVPGIWSSFA
ncbi:MAG: hypothetical protein J7K31_00610 [Candidatus Aenigmarchaeota archaeon]|nr:hypothetical protein [Candidatus Aenigmarchaeota archaeon]